MRPHPSVAQVWGHPIDANLADKRSLLIQHALRVFHRQGVNGTGIAEIMSLAGVGKGQFYYYFASKETFICEVVRHAMDYFLTRMAPFTTSLESLDDFDAWFQPYIEFAEIPDFLGCPVGTIASEMSPSTPAVRAVVGECMQRWVEALAQGLAVLQQRSGAGQETFQPLELADELAANIQGALLMGRAMQTTRYIYHLRDRQRELLRSLISVPFEGPELD